MDDELTKMLKYLRLGHLLSHWDDLLKTAQEKKYSYVQLLTEVIEQEYKAKIENSRIRRLKQAKIPEHLVIETYPFEQQKKLAEKKILTLYDSFNYMTRHENIIWIGPTGVGKTGLASAFLIQAINRGYTGRSVLFSELLEELYRSRGDLSEAKVIRAYANYDCLHIDEIGYVEMEPVQVGQFFTLMHKRHKNKTTLITSNLGFSEWDSFFKNSQLTAALIDRLLENSHVINMKNCISLRAKLVD